MSTAWKRHTKPSHRLLRVAFAAAVVVLGTALAYLLAVYNVQARPLWFLTGKVRDQTTYLVYLPDGLAPGLAVPLVFALSPNADALSMIAAWSPVAEKHHWIVAASTEFRNGQDFLPSMKAVAAELDDVEAKYAVDRTRVIFTGISGGGMGSHGFAKYYPGRVAALVINTGMMAEGSQTDSYPTGKAVVFLASPTDFRYHEMQRDRDFLTQRQWQTEWIEFAGGHTLAPADVYEQAAVWLEAHLR